MLMTAEVVLHRLNTAIDGWMDYPRYGIMAASHNVVPDEG